MDSNANMSDWTCFRQSCARPPSHSRSFDQRRRPETFLTAMALAFFWPTSTTIGGRRAATIYTITQTAILNGHDPEAYLADILARIADHPINRIDELLPWRWRPTGEAQASTEKAA
jgi:hypothetical protein